VSQQEPIVAALLEALNTSRTVLTHRLLRERIPPPRFLWDAMVIAGEVTTLTGSTGAGKSKLLCGLAVSIAAGLGEFLGQPIESGTVAVISGEDGVEFYRRQIKAWCAFLGVEHESVRSRISIYHLPSVIVEGQASTLTIHARGGLTVNAMLVDALVRSLNREGVLYAAHEEQHSADEPIPTDPLRLVIAETASTLAAGDESNEAMRELIRALAAIPRRVLSAPAVIVTHHTTKAAMTARKALDLGAGRGGGAFVANARGALTLGMEEGEGLQLRCQKLRDGLPAPPVPLVFRPVDVDGFPTAVLAPAENAQRAAGANGAASPTPEAVRRLRARQIAVLLRTVGTYEAVGEPLSRHALEKHADVRAVVARDVVRGLVDKLIGAGALVLGPPTRGAAVTIRPGPTASAALDAAEDAASPE
jgi:hypothetical protein